MSGSEQKLPSNAEVALPNVLIYTDFDGTLTGVGGEATINSAFYQSLFDGEIDDLMYNRYDRWTPKTGVQERFKTEFGANGSSPQYKPESVHLLINQKNCDFLHLMLAQPAVKIHIVTKNREDYIRALLEYQGFSPEELVKLSILSTCVIPGDKGKLVRGSLENTQTAANTHYYVFDDSPLDYNAMRTAVKTFAGEDSLLYGDNKHPGQFNFPQHTQAIIEHASASKKSPASESKEAGAIAEDNSAENASAAPAFTQVTAEETVRVNPVDDSLPNPSTSGLAGSSSINNPKASLPAEEKATITEEDYKKAIEQIRSFDQGSRSADGVVADLKPSQCDEINRVLDFLASHPDTASKAADLKAIYLAFTPSSIRLKNTPNRITLLERMAKLGLTEAQARLVSQYHNANNAIQVLHYASMLTKEAYAALGGDQWLVSLPLSMLIVSENLEPALLQQIITVLDTLGLAQEAEFKFFSLQAKSKAKAAAGDYSADEMYRDGSALFQSRVPKQKRYGWELLTRAAQAGQQNAHDFVINYFLQNPSTFSLEDTLAYAELLTEGDVQKFAPKALDAKQTVTLANPTQSVQEGLKAILDNDPSESDLARLNAVYTKLAISPPLYLSYQLMPAAAKDKQPPEEKLTTAMQLVKEAGAASMLGFTLLQQAAEAGHVEAMYQASLRGFRPSPPDTDAKRGVQRSFQSKPPAPAPNDYLTRAADAGHLPARVDLVSYWVRRPDESQALSYAAKITPKEYASLGEEKQNALKAALIALSKSDNLTAQGLSSLITVIETLSLHDSIPSFAYLILEKNSYETSTQPAAENKEVERKVAESKEDLSPHDAILRLLGSDINRHTLRAFALCKQMDLSQLNREQQDFLYDKAKAFFPGKRYGIEVFKEFLIKLAALGHTKAHYELFCSYEGYFPPGVPRNAARVNIGMVEALGYAEGISTEEYAAFSPEEKERVGYVLAAIDRSRDPKNLDFKTRLLAVFTKFEIDLPKNLKPIVAVEQSEQSAAGTATATNQQVAAGATGAFSRPIQASNPHPKRALLSKGRARQEDDKTPLLTEAAPRKAKNWPFIALSIFLLLPALGAIVLSIGALITSAAAFGVGSLVISAAIAPYTLAAGLVLGLLCAIALGVLLTSKEGAKPLENPASFAKNDSESSGGLLARQTKTKAPAPTKTNTADSEKKAELSAEPSSPTPSKDQ